MKLNTKKFIRNILICLVALVIVSFILNYAPGFKRDKFGNITNLIVNDEDLTENLKYNIYIDDDKNVYFAKEDVEQILDKNICYNEEYNTIITTSNTKTASIVLDENKLIINGVEKTLNANAFKIDKTVYIPVSELTLVYNIDIQYIENADVVVIENLNQGLIKATIEEESVMKYKPRLISKNVGETKKGEEVSCYYTTSKGWRLIRTQDGTLGYVKANVLNNEYIVRQDFDDEIKTAEIITSLKDGSTLSLYNNNQETTKIMIKTLFDFNLNGTIKILDENLNNNEYKIWATISNNGLEKQTNEIIKDYKKRTELIDQIVSVASKYNISGITIDFEKINDNDVFNRFIIELTPRLREIGITSNVILNDSFDEANIVGIVDYLIVEKEI